MALVSAPLEDKGNYSISPLLQSPNHKQKRARLMMFKRKPNKKKKILSTWHIVQSMICFGASDRNETIIVLDYYHPLGSSSSLPIIKLPL